MQKFVLTILAIAAFFACASGKKATSRAPDTTYTECYDDGSCPEVQEWNYSSEEDSTYHEPTYTNTNSNANYNYNYNSNTNSNTNSYSKAEYNYYNDPSYTSSGTGSGSGSGKGKGSGKGNSSGSVGGGSIDVDGSAGYGYGGDYETGHRHRRRGNLIEDILRIPGRLTNDVLSGRIIGDVGLGSALNGGLRGRSNVRGSGNVGFGY